MNLNDPIDWIAANANLTFEIVGTLAFAVSGIIEAARKRFDIVGMAMVTGFTAFGGGTLRDILLNRRPLFWVENQLWLWVILAMCVAAMFFVRSRHLAITERATQWPDALGLGIFAASGTYIALHAGMPPLVAVLMGVITPVFGGVLRDVVINEIPRAFNDHQPYAALAFVGGWVVVALDAMHVSQVVTVGSAAIVITGLRMVAMIRGWRLPTWKV